MGEIPVKDKTEEFERRVNISMSIRDFALFVTVGVNILAVVWGASKLTTTVNYLVESVKDMQVTVKILTERVTQIQVEYNGRLNAVEKMLDNGVNKR